MLITFAIGIVIGILLAVALLHHARAADDGLINRFEEEMQGLEDERRSLAATLEARSKDLASEVGRMVGQTQALSGALRRPGVRGSWGEATLKNVVEASGLSEHCDFETQVSVGGDGSDLGNEFGLGSSGRQRPDMIVRLPGGGVLVVDSKVPIDAYLDAAEIAGGDPSPSSGSDLAVAAMLDDHVRAVRARVAELSAKAYWRQFDRTPEMVVMFIPNEAALAAAASHDSDLLADAARRRVVIATPTTMTALLHVVAAGWSERRMADHAEEVARRSTELCGRLATFAAHIAATGRGLDAAVKAHNQTVGSFEARVMPSARRFAELGVGQAAGINPPPVSDSAVRTASEVEIGA